MSALDFCEQKQCPTSNVELFVREDHQLIQYHIQLDPHRSCCRQFAAVLGKPYNDNFKNQITIEQDNRNIKVIYSSTNTKRKREESEFKKVKKSKRCKQLSPELVEAIDNNNLEEVKNITAHANHKIMIKALKHAINRDKLSIVELLDTDIINEHDVFELLKYASEKGKTNIVQYFLGALDNFEENEEEKDDYVDPDLKLAEALVEAVIGKHVDVVNVLLPRIKNSEHLGEPLNSAIFENNINMVNLLLPHIKHSPTLHESLNNSLDNPSIFELLLTTWVKEKKEDIRACFEKEEEEEKCLKKEKDDINASLQDTMNLAIEQNQLKAVQLVLQIMRQNFVLGVRYKEGEVQGLIDALLEVVDTAIEKEDADEILAMLHAYNNRETVNTLLNAIDTAIAEDHLDVILAMLEYSHDDVVHALVKNKKMKEVLYNAINHGNENVVRSLLEKGVKLDDESITKAMDENNPNVILALFKYSPDEVVKNLLHKPNVFSNLLTHATYEEKEAIFNLIPAPITDLNIEYGDDDDVKDSVRHILEHQLAPGGRQWRQAQKDFEEAQKNPEEYLKNLYEKDKKQDS